MRLTLGLALGTMSPSIARADVPASDAAAEARRSQAKRMFDEGVEAFAQHRYADAASAFLRADAIEPSAPLCFNIARAFEHLDRPSDALRFYRDYLRRQPAAKNAAQVRTRVGELALLLAARGVQQLTVLSTPSGAEVTVDQRRLGKTPLTTELSPGLHHVRVELQGYGPVESDVDLSARTPRDLALLLERLPASEVRRPTVVPTAGHPELRTDRPHATSPYRAAPWVVLGAGGVSLLGALGFELARRSAESDARHSTQPDYPAHFDAMQSRQTTSRVLAGVGGALVVTGGVWLLLSASHRPSARVAMTCSRLACGLVAGGSFR